MCILYIEQGTYCSVIRDWICAQKKRITDVNYTSGLLVGDRKVLDGHPEDPDTIDVGVVCCVNFFAFLHSDISTR